MLRVYSLINNERLPSQLLQDLLALLPSSFHARLEDYRRWQDQQAYLFGRLLLRQALQDFFGDDQLINQFRLDKFQRPYLSDHFDFNISHCRGMVVLAASDQQRTGIDVEAHKPILLKDFRRVFTQKEWQLLNALEDHHSLFFELWTKKEAVMKADGRGFHLPPASFEGLGSSVQLPAASWQLMPLDLGHPWIAQIALKKIVEYDYQAFDLLSFLKQLNQR